MNRDLEAGVLLVLGLGLARLALEGGYLSYVKPGMRLPLLLTAAALVLLAIAALRGQPDAGHHHRPPAIGVLLLVPVMVLVVLAPPPLGTAALERAGSVTLQVEAAKSLPPLPDSSGSVISLTFSEFLLRTHADGVASVQGRPIRLEGFVAPAADGAGTHLARFAIACCAADASPRRIALAATPGIEDDAWVSAVVMWGGRRSSDGDATPIVDVLELERIEAPDWPYEPAAF